MYELYKTLKNIIALQHDKVQRYYVFDRSDVLSAGTKTNWLDRAKV